MLQFRQGDVLFELITDDPDVIETYRKTKSISYNGEVEKVTRVKTDRAVVALGEASGHEHVAEGTDVAVYVSHKREQDYAKFLNGDSLVADLFMAVVLPEGGQLAHRKDGDVLTQDHDVIDLPAGLFRVIRQREFDPFTEMSRMVWD